jgi:hypothetical protein
MMYIRKLGDALVALWGCVVVLVFLAVALGMLGMILHLLLPLSQMMTVLAVLAGTVGCLTRFTTGALSVAGIVLYVGGWYLYWSGDSSFTTAHAASAVASVGILVWFIAVGLCYWWGPRNQHFRDQFHASFAIR